MTRGAVRGRAALIWVEGPDAASFLQGLLSNDVVTLPAGDARHALLLDAKGHVAADLRVHRDGPEAFTLVVDPELGETVAGLLERYHFSEDLERIGPEPTDLVTVMGDAPPVDAGEIAVEGRVPGTTDLVVADAAAAIAALGLDELPAAALERARIAAGVPRVGVDTGPTTLVQEAGLEGTAVSFHKGCYLGQETVARTAYRGRVNRRLRGLRLAEAVAAGAAVRHGGREVGRVTSVALGDPPVALAMLRREAEPGAEVAVDGLAAPATVVELPVSEALTPAG